VSATGRERKGGGGTLLPLALAFAVFGSAIAVVQVKQHNRNLTARLDSLRQERERLQLEWAQLQLEQATLAQRGRVDAFARTQFGMVDPQDYQIVADDRGPKP
jgi:cell division protein FtsL